MTLSKKDYIKIAEILKASTSKKDIIINLANFFKDDNPAFNYELFFKAVDVRVD